MMPTTVDRKIVFYRLRLQGKRTPPDDAFGMNAVRALEKLDHSEGEHYLEVEDSAFLAAAGDRRKGHPCIRFGTVRLPRPTCGRATWSDTRSSA